MVWRTAEELFLGPVSISLDTPTWSFSLGIIFFTCSLYVFVPQDFIFHPFLTVSTLSRWSHSCLSLSLLPNHYLQCRFSWVPDLDVLLPMDFSIKISVRHYRLNRSTTGVIVFSIKSASCFIYLSEWDHLVIPVRNPEVIPLLLIPLKPAYLIFFTPFHTFLLLVHLIHSHCDSSATVLLVSILTCF